MSIKKNIDLDTHSWIYAFGDIKCSHVVGTVCRFDLDTKKNAGEEVNRDARYEKKAADLEESRPKV